jgi:hypothetical protein
MAVKMLQIKGSVTVLRNSVPRLLALNFKNWLLIFYNKFIMMNILM